MNAATVGVPRAARDAGLRSYMLSVYNYMASGVLLTGIVALLFAPYARQVLINADGRGMSPLGWIVTFSPLGFVFAMSFGVSRMRTSTLQMLFWGFAAVMGLSMSTLFLVYTGVSIAQTFFATAAAYFGPQPLGYTTKRDLQRVRHIPDHGRGRTAGRDADQHVHAVERDGPGDQRDRRAAVRRPHRLRHQRIKACTSRSRAPTSSAKS